MYQNKINLKPMQTITLEEVNVQQKDQTQLIKTKHFLVIQMEKVNQILGWI